MVPLVQETRNFNLPFFQQLIETVTDTQPPILETEALRLEGVHDPQQLQQLPFCTHGSDVHVKKASALEFIPSIKDTDFKLKEFTPQS